MKRITALFLCVVLAAAMTACSGSESETSSTAAESSTASQSASSADEASASSQEASEESSEESSEEARDYTAEEAEGEITDDGLLMVKQDGHWRAMEQFGGGSGDSYVEALNSLREQLDDSISIYSMPAPLACEFYTPLNLADNYVSQADCFSSIAERLSSGITSIDLCSVLKQHTEENIYCRTDHHWQPLGAYYAAEAFAEAASVPFDDISTYNKVTTDGYVGTLYTFYGDERIENDPEEFTYYEPKMTCSAYYYDQSFNYEFEGSLMYDVDVANSYLRFLGGDDYVVKVKTGVSNGRKLLVVKDSYGNAEIPFYTSSFEEIYVVDMRYFECNLVNFINEMDISDVLFTMAAYSVVGGNADNLDTLLTQAADSSIVDGQLMESTDE